MTNADHIRQMTDEELAELLVHSPWFREESAIKWLKEEKRVIANEYRKAMTGYINTSDFIKWIESTFCKPCKEKGDDREGVCCRVCQYEDWMAYVDSFQGCNEY